MRKICPQLNDPQHAVGHALGTGEWLLIDQPRIDAFIAATGVL